MLQGVEKTEPEPEQDKVRRHRTIQFLLLGYDIDQSDALAQIGVDHHDLSRLLAKGCSLDLAVRILV